MTGRSSLLALALALSSTACADEPTEDFAAPPEDTTGAESTDRDVAQGSSEGRGEVFENLASLLGMPNVSVYVDGPRPTSRDMLTAGDAADFETIVTVVNDGTAELAIDELEISFEVWSEDGARRKCVDADDTDPPDSLDDEDAYVRRGLASCSFPAAGSYEVHGYVAFEAGALTGDFDIERYYAGMTEVTVGG